ncbi:hypothetical protein GQ53DRAFT_474117 [Thozetella sp. PMI_491]|nr:hypothetical protein GQ53DRAFT_474117 [Thozetella sp. PMI_491]
MAGPLLPVGAFAVATAFTTLYGGIADLALVVAFTLVRQRHVLSGLVSSAALEKVWTVGQGTVAAFAVFQLVRYAWTRSAGPRWPGPSKVLLFPSRTAHSRIFPEKHSFSYSYLVVGVPVGWEGNANGMVSVGVKGESGLSSWFSFKRGVQKGWYSIDAADYLERGNGHLGLRGKLDAYLASQGADPSAYPHAYLVTAARFLGYHFNPVSFWYLYDANKSLAAMILEVNNTFGERRMYYLTPAGEGGKELEGASSGGADAPSRVMLKQAWPKDFHVSPFNSRKGAYSLAATDPLSPSMQGIGPISNTINLISSKGHGKLVARLFPEGSAVDPYSMTALDKARFLASWWWVGLVTFPRIVKQAGILFFRRKLHVWFRPEPLKESMGRNADDTERQLELVFRRYLRHLVEQATAPLAVKYIPGGISEEEKELMLSPAAQDGSADVQELEFKVLTPVFYSRFVYYAHDVEALFCESQESHTLWVSRPNLLPKLVIKKPMPTLQLSHYADFAYFKFIQALRTRPERIERPLTSSATAQDKAVAEDIRDFRISSMDGHVLAHESAETRSIYRSCVLKLFLADRIALGSVPLLEAQRFVLQALMAWALSRTMDGVVSQTVLAVGEYLAAGGR